MFLTKKHILFISTQLLLFNYSNAQNLIPNPSFEDVNICTEFNAPCSPSAWESVAPESMKLDYMYNPVTVAGNNFIRLVYAAPTRQRNYAQTQLLCPLEKGRRYLLTLVAGKDGEGIPELDLRFDTTYVFREFANPLAELQAHLRTEAKDVVRSVKGRINFYTFQREFTAEENYGYVLFGSLQEGPFNPEKEYNYIDSISIAPVGEQGMLCENAVKIKERLYEQHRRHVIPTIFYRRLQKGRQRPDLPVKCITIFVKDEKIFTGRGRALEPESAVRLDSVIRLYEPGIGMKVTITGHSAKAESYNFNKVVSLETARKIADILVYKNGFSYDDIAIEGKGNTVPRFDASTEEGREGNTYVTLECCIPQLAPEITQGIPPKPDTLVIPDVLFKFNSSELNAKLYSSLDSLIQKIPREEAIQLQLLGHTDNVGADEYNLELSRRRAMSVADYLRKKGLEQFIRHVAGMGEASPVTGNDTAEGRRKNRRVEIIIYKGAD